MVDISRRTVLTTSASALAAGLAGCSSADDRYPKSSSTVPDGPIANAPIPSEPGKYPYATMGSDTASATVAYFGNWKCPYCAQFSNGFLKTLVQDYVEPGDLQIVFRDFVYIDGSPFLGSDAPRAGRAGISTWRQDPESYWTYHETIMANQPPEDERWATTENLVEYMELAGVSNTEAIREDLKNSRYQPELERTSTAASRNKIQGTPALYVKENKQVVSPFKKQQTRNVIESAIQ